MKFLETANVQKNHDTVEARFRATHDLRKPVQESHHEQQATPSVDKPNDLTTPSTPVQKLSSTPTDSINTIPTINEKSNPKIIQNDVISTQSQNIPTPKNSNIPDQPSQVPLKPVETILKDTATVQKESHISSSSPPPQVQQQPTIHPRHIPINQQQTENISATG